MTRTASFNTTRTASGCITRRRFLAGAAGALTLPCILPAAVFGNSGRASPSERITIGVTGLGDRGSSHINTLLPMPDTQLLAVCDPFRSKCEQKKQQIEKHYADQGGKAYNGCGIYQDFRRLVMREDIDAVFIAAPEYWHGLQAAAAAENGKDIYCEKGLTLTIEQGLKLINKVRCYDRILQVGLQQRSDQNFRFACELAQNGYLGKLHTVKVGVPGGRALPVAQPQEPPEDIDYEMWLGPAPYTPYNRIKCTFNWYFIYDYCVGWIQSWGVHHIDIAQWGAPALTKGQLQIEGSAVFPKDGLADTSLTWNVNFRTEDGIRLNFTHNEVNEQGCRFEGDKGWVHVNRGGIRAEPASLLKVGIKPDEIHLYESRNHHQNFLQCVRSRRRPAATVEVGHTATALTLVADIATRLGRKLIWDWQSHRFVNDEQANRMLNRAMRSPWQL